jgi:ATP-dependent RNA helicase DDX21
MTTPKSPPTRAVSPPLRCQGSLRSVPDSRRLGSSCVNFESKIYLATRKREQKECDRSTHNDTPVKHTDDPGDFKNFPEIPRRTAEVLASKGIVGLFPIQQSCFYPVYTRKDMIARDLTGSGKTFAFGLPLIEFLRKNQLFGTGKVQAIMLAPTRELALQITAELSKLKHSPEEFKIVTVYGGVSVTEQANQLRRGVDLFVGTTGRVLDHIERGNINFSDTKSVVLDEADVMLKLGFKEDVEKILSKVHSECPKGLQVLLFSATVPDWVRDIARQHMSPDFQVVDLAQDLKKKTARNIRHVAIEVNWHQRLDALSKILNCYGGSGRIIVFTSTKAYANSLLLSDKITHEVEVMHGDIAQNQREVTIKRFKDAKF